MFGLLKMKQFSDESVDRDDVVTIPFLKDWGPIGPRNAIAYRVLTYPGDFRLKLEAKRTEHSGWEPVVLYDDGWYRGDKLRSGQWRQIGDIASWRLSTLEHIAVFLKTGTVNNEIVKEI